jgi:chromosome segregation ATPase
MTEGNLVKTDYEGNMENKLREIGAKIDDWSTKAGAAKEQAATKIQELNEKREKATKRMTEVKEASGDAWHEFKGGMDKAFDELKQAWEEIRSGSEKAADKLSSH